MTKQHHSEYLAAMGIQSWVRREAPVPELAEPVASIAETQTHPVVDTTPTVEKVAAIKVSDVAPTDQEEPPMPTEEYAPTLEAPAMDMPMSAEPAQQASIDVRHLDWPALRATVSICTACQLHQTRTQTVFGLGDHHAQWMIIAGVPDAEEDQSGKPFTGETNQLLTNMLQTVGLTREQVFITNIQKCSPPNKRKPRADEIAMCAGYLDRQIQLVAPKLIFAMGRVAVQSLLKVDENLSALRGKIHRYNDIPLVASYHPDYLQRSPKEKAGSWDDLRLALSVVSGK